DQGEEEPEMREELGRDPVIARTQPLRHGDLVARRQWRGGGGERPDLTNGLPRSTRPEPLLFIHTDSLRSPQPRVRPSRRPPVFSGMRTGTKPVPAFFGSPSPPGRRPPRSVGSSASIGSGLSRPPRSRATPRPGRILGRRPWSGSASGLTSQATSRRAGNRS